jgi:hypothetical protein
MQADGSGLLHFSVAGVGLLGPGLPSWAEGAPLLLQPADWQSSPTVVPAPQRLPATERRRAGTVVKASLVVADEACAQAGLDPTGLPTVFTSSTGDPLNCHLLCEALASSERMVSPTRFTNSVHNAAAGYWHIATRSQAMSTSLAAHDASFAAGLLEAAVQCQALQQPVLLVACDLPYPEPLHSLRPVPDVLAVALVLVPAMTGSSMDGGPARWSLQMGTARPASRLGRADLDELVNSIPAAQGLLFLQALAAAQAGRPLSDPVWLSALPGQSLRLKATA